MSGESTRIECFQIKKIPDLSLNKYQSLADTGIDGVLKRHENFLRLWHGVCMESNTSFHLLYLYLPEEIIGNRLKIYFLLQGDNVEIVKPLINKSPLSEFFVFEKSVLPCVNFTAGTTLTKKERVADIYNPMTGKVKSIHYVPKWKMNEKARLYDLFQMLEIVGQAYPKQKECAFRVDFYPVSMSSITRNSFQPVLKDLRGENDIKLISDIESVKSDNYVRDISKEYEDWITNIETNPHFRINVYGFADNTFQSKIILNAAGAEALSEGDFSVAPIKADSDGRFNILSRMGEYAEDYCFYPNQATLKSWSTTWCLSEVVPFFRFPVLYDGETIQISKETAPAIMEDGIYLGKDLNNYPVYIPLKNLPKHAFFTGMPGAGKTNTMLHLVTQLRKNKIPFLALEPAKKEYRALLGYKEMQNIYLFSPHLQSHFPLRMNPMEFPKGVRLSEHINALLEVFEGSFILEGPTYKFLSSSIEKSYIDLGWDIEDVNENEIGYPSLQDVYDNLEQEIEKSSYDGELKGNIRSFLQVRLGGLMERDAGEVYNTKASTLSPEEWLNVSAIVELEVLSEQAKNFFVLLVCHYILETLRVNPNGGIDDSRNLLPVRHVVFIEEAHNIIASSARQSSVESIDPKVSATQYIVKMLAEVRALREGIVIADQLPTALTSEVIKNTGLKVVHRMTSQDDRAQIGATISATPLQMERMASFTSGRAFIYHEKTLKAYEMQVAEWIKPEIDFDSSNDTELYSRIWLTSSMKRTITAAFKNWYEEVSEKLYNEINNLYKNATNISDKIEKALVKSQKARLLEETNKIIQKYEGLKKLWILSKEKNYSLINQLDEMERDIRQKLETIELVEVGKD